MNLERAAPLLSGFPLRDSIWNKAVGGRIAREKNSALAMIGLYCDGKHGKNQNLCSECEALWQYAKARLEQCSFGEEKPTCRACPIHCFQAEERRKIREVMRYSGPRMLLPHPILALLHLLDGLTPKRSHLRDP